MKRLLLFVTMVAVVLGPWLASASSPVTALMTHLHPEVHPVRTWVQTRQSTAEGPRTNSGANRFPPEAAASWEMSTSEHFTLAYFARTAAARDITALKSVAEASLAQLTSTLDVPAPSSIRVYLVDRVFWQGGATYPDHIVLITYIDRNYTGVLAPAYFLHELTHALGQDIAGKDGNPGGLLSEGLAVYAAGGHYGPEPLKAWAAALPSLHHYIPLADLRRDFTGAQHEIAYLEAGSLVQYLIETYGLPKFKTLYAHPDQIEALYGKTWDALEAEWLAHLKTVTFTPDQARQLADYIDFYDTMRLYEERLDPPARILPDEPPPRWNARTIADFQTHATRPTNVVLETMLVAASQAIAARHLSEAEALLTEVKAAISAGGAVTGPLGRDFADIVATLDAQDRAYEKGDLASYLVTVDPAGHFFAQRRVEVAGDLKACAFLDRTQEAQRIILDEYEARVLATLSQRVRCSDDTRDIVGQMVWLTLVKRGALRQAFGVEPQANAQGQAWQLESWRPAWLASGVH
jgi:hypothetical protein